MPRRSARQAARRAVRQENAQEEKQQQQQRGLQFKKLRELNIGDITETAFQVQFPNKKRISTEDARKIVTGLNLPDDAGLMVRGLTIRGWMTLKGFKTALNLESVEDYFNRNHGVKDVTPFTEFLALQLYVRK